MADIYDAMTSDRPYRSGWPPDRVVEMIGNLSGTHLNSRVVEIFLRTVAPYPIGAEIQMLNGPNEGYEGVVLEVDEEKLDRPQIRLLFDTAGERFDPIDTGLREKEDFRIQPVRDEKRDLEPLGNSAAPVKVEVEVVAAEEI